MSADSDPRIYFAAERTVLAWVRTGLTLMGFGFVVARFGLFLGMLHPSAASGHPVSLFVGVSLVVLGVATIAMSAVQHKRFVATLRPADLPPHAALGFPLFIAWALVALGLVLAGYLTI